MMARSGGVSTVSQKSTANGSSSTAAPSPKKQRNNKNESKAKSTSGSTLPATDPTSSEHGEENGETTTEEQVMYTSSGRRIVAPFKSNITRGNDKRKASSSTSPIKHNASSNKRKIPQTSREKQTKKRKKATKEVYDDEEEEEEDEEEEEEVDEQEDEDDDTTKPSEEEVEEEKVVKYTSSGRRIIPNNSNHSYSPSPQKKQTKKKPQQKSNKKLVSKKRHSQQEDQEEEVEEEEEADKINSEEEKEEEEEEDIVEEEAEEEEEEYVRKPRQRKQQVKPTANRNAVSKRNNKKNDNAVHNDNNTNNEMSSTTNDPGRRLVRSNSNTMRRGGDDEEEEERDDDDDEDDDRERSNRDDNDSGVTKRKEEEDYEFGIKFIGENHAGTCSTPLTVVLLSSLHDAMNEKKKRHKEEEAKQTFSFKNTLKQIYSEKRINAAHLVDKSNTGDDEVQLQDLMKEGDSIATVRKNDVFAEEMNEEDEDIIKQRVAMQQKQFREYERREQARCLAKIKCVNAYVVEEEVVAALKECSNSEEKATIKLMDITFLQEIRKKIAMKAEEERKQKEAESGVVVNQIKHIRRFHRNANSPQKTSSRKLANTDKKLLPKLKLDEALQKENFEGWSAARIRAWQIKDANPNAYYYRFNPPGETQRNGKWTTEEKEMFFKRMAEIGVNGQWGIFSMVIPGRVGYQCSNFYRHLVKNGHVKDPNYIIDAQGKAHYLFSKGIVKKNSRKRPANESDEEMVNVDDEPSTNETINPPPLAATKLNKKKKKKTKSVDYEDEDMEDDEEYRPSQSRRRQCDEVVPQKSKDNPLPGFVDAITLEEVEEPALSPYGHVMGKKTWLQCLAQEPKNVCPFTKQPLKYRDLIVLTWENINDYKHLIKKADL